jgi:hypothetical protein
MDDGPWYIGAQPVSGDNTVPDRRPDVVTGLGRPAVHADAYADCASRSRFVDWRDRNHGVHYYGFYPAPLFDPYRRSAIAAGACGILGGFGPLFLEPSGQSARRGTRAARIRFTHEFFALSICGSF